MSAISSKNANAQDPAQRRAVQKIGRPYGSMNAYTEPKVKLDPIIYALRRMRIERTITRGDLSITSGYSVRTIEDWEQGRMHPHIFNLINWAQALGCRIALLDDDDNEITYAGPGDMGELEGEKWAKRKDRRVKTHRDAPIKAQGQE